MTEDIVRWYLARGRAQKVGDDWYTSRIINGEPEWSRVPSNAAALFDAISTMDM